VSNHNLLIDAEMALKVIDAIPEIYDEPFADSSQIPAFLVSKLAAEYVQVALTGMGGRVIWRIQSPCPRCVVI